MSRVLRICGGTVALTVVAWMPTRAKAIGPLGAPPRADAVVAADGSGQFKSLQAAIFAAPTTTVTATGNGWVDLWCGDSETSVDGVDDLSVDGGDFFDGTVDEACTGFDD